MEWIGQTVVSFLIFSVYFYVTANSQLVCYSCQGGYETPCASMESLGSTEDCEGENAQCYEAVKHFQNGVIRLVERRCWKPDKASNAKDYCTSFNNPVGRLIHCKTCKTDNCNSHRYGTCGMKDPYPNNFTDFHYATG